MGVGVGVGVGVGSRRRGWSRRRRAGAGDDELRAVRRRGGFVADDQRLRVGRRAGLQDEGHARRAGRPLLLDVAGHVELVPRAARAADRARAQRRRAAGGLVAPGQPCLGPRGGTGAEHADRHGLRGRAAAREHAQLRRRGALELADREPQVGLARVAGGGGRFTTSSVAEPKFCPAYVPSRTYASATARSAVVVGVGVPSLRTLTASNPPYVMGRAPATVRMPVPRSVTALPWASTFSVSTCPASPPPSSNSDVLASPTALTVSAPAPKSTSSTSMPE